MVVYQRAKRVTRLASKYRQQLSTTSLEASELESGDRVNYPVHTWTGMPVFDVWISRVYLCVCGFSSADCMMHPSFQPFTQQPLCTIPLWQIEIFHQNRILQWNIHHFIRNFTNIQVSTDSQGEIAAISRWGGKIKTSVDGIIVLVISVPKNSGKRTILVQFIVENVVRCYFGHSVYSLRYIR